jgi:hypothetical protein
MSTPPVLRAPRRGVLFKLYIAPEEKIIGAVLTQEDKGKEYVIAYLGLRLLDPETRYALLLHEGSEMLIASGYVPPSFL